MALKKLKSAFVLILPCIALVLQACGGGGSGAGSGTGNDQFDVVSQDPAPTVTNVDIDQVITVEFTKAVNVSSVNDLSFIVSGPVGNVPGTLSVNNHIVTFSADSPFDHSTTYTVSLSSAIQDTGSPPGSLNSTVDWSFTTRPPWIYQFGTSTNDAVRSLALNDQDQIFLTGVTLGDLVTTNNGQSDIFTMRFDAAVASGWRTQQGSSQADVALDIAVDSEGNVYITGVTEGDLHGQINSGGMDLFLSKYSSSGALLWTRLSGNGSALTPVSIAVDSADNIFVGGYALNDLDGQANKGSYDYFLMKFDSNGNKLWTKLDGTSEFDILADITVDLNDQVIITGLTQGALNGYTQMGVRDIIIIKTNNDGAIIWERQFGDTGSDGAVGVTTDDLANIYITGFTKSNLDGQINSGSGDGFLMKYSSAGTRIWTRLIGTSLGDRGISVSVDSTGNPVIAGLTSGDLDGNVNVGKEDVFVSKYNASGTKLWTTVIGSTLEDYVYSVVIDSTDDNIIAGFTNGVIANTFNAGGEDAYIAKINSAGVLK